MSDFTLNGIHIVSGSIVVPYVGVWTADIAISDDTAETGSATLIVGNLTLSGHIFRSDTFAGQTRCRIVGGAGGWRSTLPAKAYGNPSGVNLSMVLGDAARESGEKVNVAKDTSVGPFYVRPSDLASFTLRTFCPFWYVDPSGVTQTTTWPISIVASTFTVTKQDPDQGLVEVATEDYASFLPGASFSAPNLDTPVSSFGTIYSIDTKGTVRVQVLTDTKSDRILGPLRSIIDLELAGTRFLGRYRYTISNPSLTTVDCAPIDTTIGLPALQGVPLDSDSISTYIPPNGGECHVMFLDGKPTLPRIVWTAGTATVVNVMGGSNPVARQGDQTQSFLPPTLTLTCSGTLGGTPFVGTAVTVIPNPISGSIVQGSPSANVP